MDKEASGEVTRKIGRVLMEEWDPIGVNDTPEAADEYDAYIGGIYGLLDRGSSEGALYSIYAISKLAKWE